MTLDDLTKKRCVESITMAAGRLSVTLDFDEAGCVCAGAPEKVLAILEKVLAKPGDKPAPIRTALVEACYICEGDEVFVNDEVRKVYNVRKVVYCGVEQHLQFEDEDCELIKESRPEELIHKVVK